ncbi:hypothetical protein J6590_083051 [Homalodisca vitripennis]|nr:hypothetical protein J6590_083051 [Homalodisca vitripennis]
MSIKVPMPLPTPQNGHSPPAPLWGLGGHREGWPASTGPRALMANMQGWALAKKNKKKTSKLKLNETDTD